MARHAPHGKCIFLPSRSPPRNVDKSLKGFQTILRDDLSLFLSRTTYWSRNDREREWSNASNLTKLMTEFRERMARLKKKKKETIVLVDDRSRWTSSSECFCFLCSIFSLVCVYSHVDERVSILAYFFQKTVWTVLFKESLQYEIPYETRSLSSQTFHTPSFGDEDFDIPAIHSHSHQQHQQQQQQPQQQQQQQHQTQQQTQPQHDSMHGYQTQVNLPRETTTTTTTFERGNGNYYPRSNVFWQMMQTGNVQQSSDGLNLDPGGYQQSLYLQQDHSMQQPISVR